MRLYYEIARHSVCIECIDNHVMEALGGFHVFQSEEYDMPEMCINLKEDIPQPIEGNPYYSITTSIATSLFYKNGIQCGLEIKQNDKLKLSLKGNDITKIYYIQGSMKPELLNYALWFAFNTAFAQSKTLAIHASAIIYKGKAWLYTGSSGTGKSTHTRLIYQCFSGVELLNDDSPIMRIENGKCMVYGSPWSGKTQCYKQQSVEMGGVVKTHQAAVNKISLLPLHQAIGALLTSFPPELYLCLEWQDKVIIVISEIIEQKHVYFLECLPDEKAARLSIETITNAI